MTVTAVRERQETSFVRATSQLLAGSVLAQLLVAVTFAVAARGLGRPVFGLVVALLGIGAIGQDCLDFGTSQWLGRELAAGRLTPGAVRDVLRRRAVLTVVFAAVIIAAALAGTSVLLAAALGAYMVAAVGNAGVHAQLRAAGLFRRAAGHLVAERLAWLVMVVLIVGWRPGRETAAASLVAAMAVAYVGSNLCAPRLAISTSDSPPLAEVYRRSVSFGLLGLASDLQQLDATAAAGFAGVGVAADVGIASKLTGPVGLVAGAVTQVAFRGVARGGSEARSSARSALRISGGLALGIAAAAPLLPAIAVTVLGGQYDGARTAIIIYALGTALAVLNQPLTGILTGGGSDRRVARVVGPAVVLGLVVGSLTVRPMGAPGMALGFCVTQAVIFAACVTMYRRGRR